jgi:hypothetical protein
VSAVKLDTLEATLVHLESHGDGTCILTLGDVCHYYDAPDPATSIGCADEYLLHIELAGDAPSGASRLIGRQVDEFWIDFPGGGQGTLFDPDFSATGECALEVTFRGGGKLLIPATKVRFVPIGPIDRHTLYPVPPPQR